MLLSTRKLVIFSLLDSQVLKIDPEKWIRACSQGVTGMESDSDEFKILGRKYLTKLKRLSGLSWQAELRESETKRDGAEMLSPLSNNALTNYAAAIKSCGLI